MNIRTAKIEDACRIQNLILQLGFDQSLNMIEAKLVKLLDSNNDIILIYEKDNYVVGLITLSFSTQLAFDGDIMTIGYLVIDEQFRGLGIGKALEEYAMQIAQSKKCSMIEVYSQLKRADAHRFYIRQGYQVAEKFFIKEL